ncbi:delta-like protein D [Anneissia japonica]|uniref:delta-like protein D n=1 Tax=Anneissia japonica TaxID=1529436 RepID=UPI001425656A|nr:delta-like protein D [Anneissia japonica]
MNFLYMMTLMLLVSSASSQVVNQCSPNPCLNGGICFLSQASEEEYVCLWTDSFLGDNCEVFDVSNNGICPDCYTGDNCEILLNACDNNACQNGAGCVQVSGSCTAYECSCPNCYTGQFCETSKEHISIIQAYAPANDYGDSVIEEFYEYIDKAIKENHGKYTVLMGDFNAKLGKCEAGEEL